MARYTISPGCQNQRSRCSKFRREFQIAALRVRLNKAVQALKEQLDDCDKSIFNTTNFHRFRVHFFNHLQHHWNDQKWLWFYRQYSTTPLSKSTSFVGHIPIKKLLLILITLRPKWLTFLPTLKLVIHLQLKFPRKIICCPSEIFQHAGKYLTQTCNLLFFREIWCWWCLL